MKKLIALALILTSTQAFCVTAFFTGRSQPAFSVTNQVGFNCEYEYAGTKFIVFRKGYCTPTVDVE